MSEFTHDIALAWRNAWRQPASSLLIIITLALGLGVNTAIFSMTWNVLLAPLPYADGDRLVTLRQDEASKGREGFSWSRPTLSDFREQNNVFSELIKYNSWALTFVGRGEPYQGLAGLVTGSFFETLGVKAALGRLLSMDDDRPGAEPVLMLSHEFWLGKFAGDPAVIGTTLEIQHSLYRIVGVLPRMPGYPHANDVWIPDTKDPYALAGVGTNPSRRALVISRVIGKLLDGITFEEAARDTEVIAQRLAVAYPDDYAADYNVTLVPLKDELTRDSRLTVLLLMALAALVVLIACANVANLNLARTMARNQELAIREAVGASPGRIVRQLLTENLILAFAGSILGLLIAWPCLRLLADFASRYTPLASEIRMGGSVLLFSFILALAAGILGSAVSFFGKRDINKALKEGGDKITASVSGVHRRNALLMVQFAFAFVVLTVSALIILSLARLNRQDLGFELDQVLTVNMILNVDLSDPMQMERKMRDFSRGVLTAISNIPEVSQAAIRTGAPLLEQVAFSVAFPFEIEGWSATEPGVGTSATINMISEDYFKLMDISLLQGRPFLSTDDENAVPVAIVNESFAKRFFPEGNTLGGNIRLSGVDDEWRPIVGVVADVRSTGIDETEGPVVYYSYWQFSVEGVNLYVKTAANAELLARNIAGVVHELDPRQAVLVKPLGDIKSTWLAPARLRATLIGLFGLLSLVVTLSGVIGVVSYNIGQHVREIGIRMAIGATPSRVVTMFIGEGLKVYAAGLLLGLALMLAIAPSLEPLLYQTSATDAGIYLLSMSVLTLVVLGAIYLPASKAGAMSPVAALHCE
ncbi:MAG TPA: ABC transporter permease [Hyphomicrobiales bacterium]|nr:ABC transporter permease [Hyphomicrobiales bacterium]